MLRAYALVGCNLPGAHRLAEHRNSVFLRKNILQRVVKLELFEYGSEATPVLAHEAALYATGFMTYP